MATPLKLGQAPHSQMRPIGKTKMLSPTVSGSAKSRRKGAGWRHGVVAASIICLSSLTAPATDAAGTGPEIVRTAGGPVQATPRNGMRSYFAIPYAAPPVGDLRWRPPQPAPAWTSPIHRSATGASCLQTSNSPFRSGGEGEDCLYLDVHAPTGKGPYPVMVWIHGGAFVTGSASVFSDPTPLVSKGVIVVAINYRLGAMGFLAHPALRDADGSAGDYGIMDQQAALRWVKANIAAFGGDTKEMHPGRKFSFKSKIFSETVGFDHSTLAYDKEGRLSAGCCELLDRPRGYFLILIRFNCLWSDISLKSAWFLSAEVRQPRTEGDRRMPSWAIKELCSSCPFSTAC